MITVPYSSAFRLPAPVVEVFLSHPDGPPAVALTAQLDTGSDRTVIPLATALALRLSFLRDIQAGVVGGAVLTLPLYEALIRIDGVTDFVLDVAADATEPRVLLGRDVLSALHTQLDGPGRMLTLSAQPLPPPTP